MSNKPNNTFSYTYIIKDNYTSFTVTLPDGMYTIDEINDYLEYTMKENKTYLVDSSGHDVFFINLKEDNTDFQNHKIYIRTHPQLRSLPDEWSNPGGLELPSFIGNPTITFSGNIIKNLGLNSSFTSSQPIRLNTSYVKSYSFFGNYNYIYLPSYININSNSFSNIKTELTDITITNNSVITSIPSNTFLNFTKLTNYTIGNTIKNINDNAFQGCSSLTQISIPSSVTRIGDSVFKYCTNLTKISLKDISNNELGTNMFNGCSGLTSIQIPYYVTSIGDNAFQGCNGLTSLDENAFQNKVIGAHMFHMCNNLTTVIIPNSVTSIGNNAFYGCEKLSDLYISNTTAAAAVDASNNYDLSVIALDKASVHLKDVTDGILAARDAARHVVILAVDYENVSDINTVNFGVNTLKKVIIKYIDTIDSYSGENKLENFLKYAFVRDFVRDPSNIISYFNYDPSGNIITNAIGFAYYAITYAISYGVSAFKEIVSRYTDTIHSFPSLEAFIEVVCNDAENAYAEEHKLFNALINVTQKRSESYYAEGVKDYTALMANVQPVFDDYCFSNCYSLKTVVISSSVKYKDINYTFKLGAFQNCKNLTNIIETPTDDAIYQISDYMFGGCEMLGEVIIPSFVTSIGNNAFERCSKISNFVIPNSVKIIQSNVFNSCFALREIIPGNILNDTISDYMFNRCFNLTGVVIPMNVTNIGKYSFSNCTSLKNITIPCNLILDDTLFYNCNNITVTISSGIGINSSSIIDSYMNNTKNISRIIISTSITSIGSNAFENCVDLTQISIPSSIVSFSKNIFAGCIKLTHIDENILTMSSIPNNLFYGCNGITSLTIPSYVTSIGSYAFALCYNIPNIIIPSGVTSIGSGAFQNCLGLTSITGSNILNNVIGADMFANCTNITNVIIPSRVTSIGSGAFQECSRLTSITGSNILNNVIGAQMFYRCANITNVIIPSQVTSVGDYAFSGNPYINNIVLNNAVIGSNMFGVNYTITVLTIPSNITSIGNNAFVGFEKLKSINFQNNVIGDYMFSMCNNLYTIRIPISVTSIGKNAFSYCHNLLNINLYRNLTNSPSLTILGSNSFKQTAVDINHFSSLRGMISSGYTIENLLNAGFNKNAIFNANGNYVSTVVNNVITNIDIANIATNNCFVFPNNATSMNEPTINKIKSLITEIYFGYRLNLNLNNLLSNFSKLTTIYLSNITIIGDYLFSGCSKITSITLPDTITSIGNYAFQGCTSLKSITIPDTITSIGNYTFQGCTSLKSITIPSSVINISNNAFQGCTSLTSVTIPSTTTNIGDYGFQGCTSLISIAIPLSVTSIGNYAFESCSSLTSFTIDRDFTYDSLTTLGYMCFSNCVLIDIYCFFELFSNGYSKVSIANAGFSTINRVLNLTVVNGVLTDFPNQTIEPNAILCIPNNVSSISDTINTTNYYSSIKNSLNTIFFTKNNIITNIPSNFFPDCYSLSSILISPSITNIGTNAFKNCVNLAHLKFFDLSTIQTITFNTNCFFNVGNTNPISNSLVDDLTIVIKQLNYLVGKNTLTNAGFYSEIIDIANGIDLIIDNNIIINANRSIKYLNTSVKENIIVPLGITSIYVNAFSNVANYVNKVYLSNDLLSIGSRAFVSNSLTDITIPPFVSSVGDYAFQNCVNLKNIVIQNSVIGNYMFQNCTSITSITIPSNVTSVGDYAFQGCTNLQFIYISNATNPIFGTGVFKDCIKITNLDDYDSTVFGSFMFENCNSLVSANVYTDNINDGLFMNCDKLTSVSLPSVTNIGNSAFNGCSKLVNIILPSSLTNIGDSAFEDCIMLTNITIPSSVINIGDSAFKNCYNLVVINKTINLTQIKPYTFYNVRGNITAADNYFVIDDTNNNFSYSLNYDYSVENYYGGHEWKTTLKTFNVNIPNGLYIIDDLNKILHDSFDSIGFYKTTSVGYMKDYTYYDFFSNKWITTTNYGEREIRTYYVNFDTISNTIQLIIDNVNNSIMIGRTYNVNDWLNNNIYYNFINNFNPIMHFPIGFSKLFGNLSSQFNFNDTTNTFSSNLNLGNTNQLTYISNSLILYLPRKITSIGEGAFANTTYKYVDIPDSVTSIGDGAFANSELNYVIISPNVTSIGAQAFYINYLTNITIPSSVISIGELAFDDNSLININLQRIFRDFNNVTTLGNNCFGSSYTHDFNNQYLSIYGVVPSTAKKLSYTSDQFREYYFKGYTQSDLANAGFDNNDINNIAVGTIYFDISNNTIVSASRKDYGIIAEAIIPGNVTSIGDNVFADYNQNFNRLLYDVPANHLVNVDFGMYSKLSNIGENAFKESSFLTNITIPTSVTSIGNYAFGNCTGLTNIIIPSNVTSIGFAAFYYCTGLTAIPNILNNNISASMFNGCTSLKSVTIPSNITSVGDNAFEGCSGLTSVNILNNNISTSMFKGCSKLTSIQIPLKITSVGDNAFENCTELTSINILNNNISAYMFKGCSKLTSIQIPSNITSIGDNAFENCTGLTKLDNNSFLNSVISNSMFVGCHGLKSVIIPSNITQIGDLAFSSLNNLDYVNINTDIRGSAVFSNCHLLRRVDISTNCKYIGFETFANCNMLSLLNSSNIYKIVLPNSITFVHDSAFAGCAFGAFTTGSYALPSNSRVAVSYSGPMGSNMFQNNDYLQNINLVISKNTLNNASYAFQYNANLKNVYFTISEQINIPDNMFVGCSKLSFTIPPNVTSVGVSAFDSINNIKNISSTITSIGSRAFANISGLTDVTLFSTVTSLGTSIFSFCTNLTNVNIQNSVITDEMFINCSSLQNITIPLSVTSIGANAFQSCTSLKNIVISASVSSIGSNVFQGCTGLKILDESSFLNSVIGKEMFRQCNGLTSVTIPSNITHINNSAFYDCKGLTNVNIQNSVIGSSMFRGCYALRNIIIPLSVTSIGNYAFSPIGQDTAFDSHEISQPNIGLTSVTIQNSVIGNNMFVHCYNLKNITIPLSVTSIGDYAFYDTRLTNVTIQNNIIGSSMFRNCYSLQNITIPSSVTSIGDYAFYNCSQLANVKLPKNYLNQLTPLGQDCFYNTIINNNNIKQLYVEGYLRTNLINAGINNDRINNSIGDINININDGILTDLTSVLGIPGVVLIPDSVTSISNSIFNNNSSIISEIYFYPTSSLVNIASNLFENCNLLTNITLPLNITNINSNAFQGCSSLTNIIIPNKVIQIGENTFQDCSSLKSITIPCAAVIDSSAFTSCSNIDVTISKGDTSSTIKPNFLYSIPQITTITINNDITKIGSQCFYGCNKINSIKFKST
jgi:hypothetical protein